MPPPRNLPRIEILEYGIFERGAVLGEFSPPNMGYRHQSVAGLTHLETTRVIPGQIGVTFGIRYRVEGNGIGIPVPLKVVLRFPPQGLYSPEFREALHSDATEGIRNLGEDDFSAHTFDYPWEIEPGIWTFEIWHGDEKLAEEQFEVITPPVS
jgi:hypothetical protein